MERNIKRGSVVRLKSDILGRGMVVAKATETGVFCEFYDKEADDFVVTDRIDYDIIDDVTESTNRIFPCSGDFQSGDIVMLRCQPEIKMLFTVGKVVRDESGEIIKLYVHWKNSQNFYKCATVVPQEFKKLKVEEAYMFVCECLGPNFPNFVPGKGIHDILPLDVNGNIYGINRVV